MLTHGIHDIEAGRAIQAFLDTRYLILFDPAGRTVAGSENSSAEEV